MLNLSNVKKGLSEYLTGINDISEHEKNMILEKLLDTRGAIWKFMVAYKPYGKALLIGAEWSSTCFSLAENFREAVVWDVDPLRIDFLNYIAKSLSLDNISFYNENLEDFSDLQGEFDLVVLENSLTWLPLYLKGSPDRLQKNILQSATKFLNAQGQCLILMQNRFAYDKWKGEKSNYGEIPFITLLPRRLGNWYSHLVKNQEYRTYTHSLSGLSRLSNKVGLLCQRTYFFYPNSDNPEQIFWGDKISPSGRVHPIVRLFNKWGIGKYFQSSFALLAGYGPANKNLIEHILQELQDKLNFNKPPTILKCILSGISCIIFFLQLDEDNEAVLRIPFDENLLGRLRNACNNIENLKIRGDRRLAEFIPAQLVNDSFAGQYYFLEKKVLGISAKTLIKSPGELTELIKKASELIVEINMSSKTTVRVDSEVFEKYFLVYFQAAEPYLHEYKEILKRIIKYLRELTYNRHLLLVLSHGDCNLGNIIINPANNRLSGIIDWDMSELEGLPLIDLFHLILSKYRFSRSWSLGTAVIKILLPWAFDEKERKIIEGYKRRFKIDNEMQMALMIMYWSVHILRNLVESGGQKSSGWMKENIESVLRYINQEVL